MTYTKEQIESIGYTGNLRGEHFIGEFPNGGKMDGYGIYGCIGGEIDVYGDFSTSGKPCDREDAGDCIESKNENRFKVI